MVLESRDKKRGSGGFLVTSLSEYSITKSKIQGIFKPSFATHRAKLFINFFTSRIGGREGRGG